MYKILLPVIIIILLLLENPLPVYSATYQKITFYSGLNQGGSAESLAESDLDITSTLVQNAQSLCADLGVWKLRYRTASGISTEYHGGSLGYNYCYGGDADSPIRVYLSAEPIGTLDLEQPSLSIFSREQYQGDFVTFPGDEEGAFDTVRSVRSYTVTGSANWAAYSGLGQTGRSVCLYASPQAGALGYGMVAVSYLQESLEVGSVRRGCDGDDLITTRKPIDEGPSGGSGHLTTGLPMPITVAFLVWVSSISVYFNVHLS